ncbi:LuxR C-terminal-related transcriptional regulator [Chryseolinea lacunae]|uniref:Response regulator transcription factor n=1 Tax=Chryseolinea lacunae TaxID=2801331 RepID=A0ABS1KNK4_9BACT|nr:response regulator transcription factor [Chryseolinea lacunae]MBL0740837.1 response regulator transcription factor [Chryseolinea lacunae]
MLRKRITLIDQDENFCTVVSSLIRVSGKYQLVSSYNDCREALRKIKDDFTEIVIMDIDFAEMKGTDFIMKIREKIPGLEILITTNYEDEEIVFSTLSHGASGYLLKRNCIEHLLEALNTLTSGGSPLDPIVARQLVRSMHISEISPLSTRESMVLKLLIQGKTYSTIATELYISGETVKSHLKNIYKKLNVNSKAEAVKKAITDQLVTGHMGYFMSH